MQGKNILLYSREPEMLLESDVDLSGTVTARPTDAPELADQFRRLKALFVSSAFLLDENRVWSWKEFGSGL